MTICVTVTAQSTCVDTHTHTQNDENIKTWQDMLNSIYNKLFLLKVNVSGEREQNNV